MNILFICDEYPPGKHGGIGSAVRVLARALAQEGHLVCVVGLYDHFYGQKDYEEDQGVLVWRQRHGLNLGRRFFPYRVFYRLPRSIRALLNGKRAFARHVDFIRRIIAERNIQVIEITDWNAFALKTGVMVKWPAFNVPLVLKSHGSYTYFYSDLGLPVDDEIRRGDESLFARADALSAVSRYVADRNRQLFKTGKPARVLYNAIEAVRVPAVKRKERLAIFTGTLIERKGIHQLMKAWNLVIQRLPDARLAVYGKGPVKPAAALLSAGARNSVLFMGSVSRERILEELAGATLAVFPSFSETFGLMCLEAMSTGCPVIYTKRSCGPEIVQDGHDGKLVEPSDVTALADAIVELFTDDALRSRFSRNAVVTVSQRFAIKESVREHLDFYETVISNFRQGSDDSRGAANEGHGADVEEK